MGTGAPPLPNLVNILRALDCSAEDFGSRLGPWGVPAVMRTCRPSRVSVVKTTTYTVRASAQQARRWALVARWLKKMQVRRQLA